MTLIKYTPQALLNAQRCSTEGWSINNVLLDVAGGLLSFGQVGLNAFARGDLSVITGQYAGCAHASVCAIVCVWGGGVRYVDTVSASNRIVSQW